MNMDTKSTLRPRWRPQFRTIEKERGTKVSLFCLGLLLGLVFTASGFWRRFLRLWQVQSLAVEAKLTNSGSFLWSEINPSNELEYHDCYDGFKCARLELPMDYHSPIEARNKVALAVIRKPAQVPVSDPHYG